MKNSFRSLKPVACYLFISLAIGIFFGNLGLDLRIYTGILLGICCIAFVFLNRHRFVILLCMLVCFGCLDLQTILFLKHSDNHITHYLDADQFTITAKIVSFTKNYSDKHLTTIECRQLTLKTGKKINVNGKINLTIYGQMHDLPKFNDTIMFHSKIKSPHNFNNPGGFDYEKHLKLHKIFGTAYTTTQKMTILSDSFDHSFLIRWIQRIEQLRNDFSIYVSQQTMDSNGGKVIVSLVTGKKELILQNLRDLLSKAGISHLLAISGLHLSIVGLIFYWIFYQIMFHVFSIGPSWLKCMLVSGECKKIAGVLTLIPLLFYTGFSGFSPSSQRAFIMASVFLLSFVFENDTDTFSSLCLAGLIILFIDSAALFSISFQLSFSAVYFIISGLSVFKINRIGFKKKIVSKVLTMGVVTLLAGIGTFPLTAHYFNMVSFVQLFSNLIAVPIIGFIVLPLGFIALSIFSFIPFISDNIIWLSDTLVMAVLSFSQKLTSYPFSWYRITRFDFMDIIAVYFLLICLMSWFKNHKKTSLYLMIIPLAWWGADQSCAWFHKPASTQLTVTILDVGQGSSSLIQGPDQKNILVDGGGFSSYSTFDPGRNIIAPFLWKKKITTLDTVVLSHPEADHLNGLVYIVNNFKVKTLIKNTDTRNTMEYKQLIDICKKNGVQILYPVFYPQKIDMGLFSFVFFDAAKQDDSFNNRSLVFKLSYNTFSMLFAGDILKERENRLSSQYLNHLKSNVLVAPHHGSSTSSQKIFLDKVDPESVIISCGWQNRFGFPHGSVLNRYTTIGTNVYRTDENGAIFILTDGKTYQVKTHRGK